MILIADSGSTKTDWVLTDGFENYTRYSTIGYNPYFISTDKIYNSLSLTLIPQLDSEKIKIIFFYGAGCSNPQKTEIVHKALSKCFPNSELHVKHDLLGAARALLGNDRGFIAIIGTGSNTCFYDGKVIETSIDSLGYLLGDEGSGCYIGKKIIQDFMRANLPPVLHDKFKETHRFTNEDIYDFIYNKPLPNRFLASFCKFAHNNKEHEHIKLIVRESFNSFFKNLVTKYKGYENYSFNSVGSVGYIFKDILKEVALSYNMEVGKIISSPIENLVSYHLDKGTSTNINN